jgi:hypothetical protein
MLAGKVFAGTSPPRQSEELNYSHKRTNTLGAFDSTCPILSTSPLNLHEVLPAV